MSKWFLYLKFTIFVTVLSEIGEVLVSIKLLVTITSMLENLVASPVLVLFFYFFIFKF